MNQFEKIEKPKASLIKKLKLNYNTLQYFMIIIVTVLTLNLFFYIYLQHTFSKDHIVIFDKEAVFQEYLNDIKNKSLHFENKNQLQSYLTKRNTLFIKYMINDLYEYQTKHHVIIIKRSALAAPHAFSNSASFRLFSFSSSVNGVRV